MSTRLSTFCDKLLEAGWLAAVIVAPLFFNVYSNRVFEPDKIALVRSIALLMAAVWLVRQVEIGLPKISAREIWRENPLILPTLAVVAVYLIATVLSVVPNISFWGSYQRLQGTDSTFSYIVIFLIAAATLRARAQFDRAINTMIVTSFPVAFYGIIQHFKLDPLPWGGDTTERVASNMGNSIFVAAYLIMIVPLTIVRGIETLTRLTQSITPRVAVIGVAVAGLVALIALWMIDFNAGIGVVLGLFIVVLLLALIKPNSLRDLMLTATYAIVLATQIVAIIFTQSRGPILGLGAGMFAFALLGALMIMRLLSPRWRTITLGSIVSLATLVIAFLIVFNLPATPLEGLKRVPYVGRLGQILDPNSPTARVRELIWQGALQLFLPHQPIWSPTTGDDPFNMIRPLVGYGPEAMYVTFNPFYPPELGQLEARNASPDRSHNETFDSLVMTGLLGFGAYILLFISIFYYGLKWLGLITSNAERNIFVALWLVGGFAFALIFGMWRGWHWIGVALPAGMIVGLLIFLVGDALRRFRTEVETPDARRALWLIALIAALIAHFVEIHFGIAIVSTRTHFWFYAALLVVLGLNRLSDAEAQPVAPKPALVDANVNRAPINRRRQRRRAQEQTRGTTTARAKTIDVSPAPVIAWTAIASIILITLCFEFITNQAGTASAFEALQRSLMLKADGSGSAVYLLFALTWIFAGMIGLAERVSIETWVYDVLLFVILSFTAALWFVMFQTRWLTTPGELTNAFVDLLSLYYLTLGALMIIVALTLWLSAPRAMVSIRAGLNAVLIPIALVGVGALIYLTNYSLVRADIVYKAGLNYDAQGAWERSIDTYQRSLDLQPAQDFYALFLGRANLEAARNAADATRRAQWLAASEKTLTTALNLNPLNTDHSANLARMHRIMATLTDKPAERTEQLRLSSKFYDDAARLSPTTAYLRNEWSITLTQAGDYAGARTQLEKSLQIDPRFAQTHVFLGDVYRVEKDFAKAAAAYLRALELDPNALSESDGTLQAGAASVLILPEYASQAIAQYAKIEQANPKSIQARYALSDLYKRAGKIDLARQELEAAAQIAPNDLIANLTLVNFLSEQGQVDAAVTAMKRVMELVPSSRSDYQRFADFNTSLQALQRDFQAVQKSPNDINARNTLALDWKARGQPQFALPEYQAIVRLAPNLYDAHKNLVLLNLQLDRIDDAQASLATAITLSPDNEKPLWQNIQVAINAHKTAQWEPALKAAQDALNLASAQDKPALQGYLTLLQGKAAGK